MKQGRFRPSIASTICDIRWFGMHGIGRFASETYARCGFGPLNLSGRPLDLYDPWRLRNALLAIRPAHFFSPGFNAPIGRPCSFSLTVHDLIHLEVQQERSIAKSLYYRAIVLPGVRNADAVFTVSEYSRQKIAEWSGVDAAKIINVGNGVSMAYSPSGSPWLWEKPYFLYVGNQKPHKNVDGLIAAYANSRLAKDVDLLMTGNLSEATQSLIVRHGLEGRVLGLGAVEESELPKLYRSAFAVVMPSRYEGFGLPLIEAMASGVPVLSSNRTSLPEVGGHAVAYFDPDDQNSLVAGLDALEREQLRNDLVAAGLERAKKFSWDAVAERIQAVTSQLSR